MIRVDIFVGVGETSEGVCTNNITFLLIDWLTIDGCQELSLKLWAELDWVVNVVIYNVGAMVKNNFWGTLKNNADIFVPLSNSGDSELSLAVRVERDHAFNL